MEEQSNPSKVHYARLAQPGSSPEETSEEHTLPHTHSRTHTPAHTADGEPT